MQAAAPTASRDEQRKCPVCHQMFKIRRDLAARADRASRAPTCSNRCRGIAVRRRRGETTIAPEVKDEWLRTAYATAYCTAATNARQRRGGRGIGFFLTHELFNRLVTRCGHRCEVTGIAFAEGETSAIDGHRAWMPSLDRIRSDLPYEASNCRIVCVAVNNAMSTWGEAVLRELAAAYRSCARSRKPDSATS